MSLDVAAIKIAAVRSLRGSGTAQSGRLSGLPQYAMDLQCSYGNLGCMVDLGARTAIQHSKIHRTSLKVVLLRYRVPPQQSTTAVGGVRPAKLSETPRREFPHPTPLPPPAQVVFSPSARCRSPTGGRKVHDKRERRSSSVVINLAVQARAEGAAIISGWRAGIDGPWRIAGVTHRLNRSEGAEAALELRKPGDSVGKDGR
jgi:hypothetical protein